MVGNDPRNRVEHRKLVDELKSRLAVAALAGSEKSNLAPAR